MEKFQNRISFYPSVLCPNPSDLEAGSGTVRLYFAFPSAYTSFSIADSSNHTLTFQFDRSLKDYVLLEGDTVVYSPPSKDSGGTTDSGDSSSTETGGGMPHRDDFYDVYDYDDPEDFYYDNEDDFDSYEDAEDYYDEAWDE